MRAAVNATEKKLWVVYALMAAVVVTLSIIAVQTLRTTTAATNELLSKHLAELVDVERLRAATERESRRIRSYLLAPDGASLARFRESQREALRLLEHLKSAQHDSEHAHLVAAVDEVENRHNALLNAVIAERQAGADSLAANRRLEQRLREMRGELDTALDRLEGHELAAVEQGRAAELALANRELLGLLIVALGAVLFSGGLGVVLAQTLRRLAQNQLALERSNRDLDAFAGQVAHDLRNVLSPLFFSAAQLRLLANEDQGLLTQVDRLERSGRRARRIIDGMLAFARAGGPPPSGTSASLPAVVAEVAEDFADQAKNYDATVELEVPQVQLACDPALLLVVVANIVGNAIKAVDGRPSRRVRVSARVDGAWCELTVEDTGPGIPPEYLTRVFEPFFRVPGTKTPGSGIGLAAVQRVVTAHGGTVAVAAAKGGGATFVARLPVATDKPEAPVPERSPRTALPQ